MIHVKFMSLSGKFQTLREQSFNTTEEAKAAVEAHAIAGGYSNVKMIDEDLGISFRFTARTPGGRGGRNVAYMDFDEE